MRPNLHFKRIKKGSRIRVMTLACRHAWLDIQGVLHNSDSIEYIFQDKPQTCWTKNPTKWSKIYTQNILHTLTLKCFKN